MAQSCHPSPRAESSLNSQRKGIVLSLGRRIIGCFRTSRKMKGVTIVITLGGCDSQTQYRLKEQALESFKWRNQAQTGQETRD